MESNSITISPVNMKARAALDLRAGDTVRVVQKIVERVAEKSHAKAKATIKEKTRSQAFEGLVLARKHGREAGATFTVRKSIDGIGVERIFPLYSPVIEKIEVLKRAKVRRAKLYHIRNKATKEIKRAMRHTRMMQSPEEVAEAAPPAPAPESLAGATAEKKS